MRYERESFDSLDEIFDMKLSNVNNRLLFDEFRKIEINVYTLYVCR